MNDKDAIAIITYSRAQYFELVFSSILNQRINGVRISDLYDIYVFHDGLANDGGADTAKSHAAIARLVEAKSNAVTYVGQSKNLGIALHFDYIERFLFEQKGYGYGFFFEDDLLLAPGHMQTLSLLRERFGDDERVGMIAANSTGAFHSIEVQKQNQAAYLPMDHNWAFGLSREFWRRRQPFVDLYLKFVRDIRYKDRPTQAILKWLDRCGLHARASSQDYIKQCATAIAGGVRISTFPNYGLYIGREGVHCTPELFSKMGFSESQVYPHPIDKAADLSASAYAEIFGKQLRIHLKNPAAFSVEGWQSALNSGAIEPDR